MKRLKHQKGFTLAELLIVVAIIAVLVAISIPVFTSQLEKSREATDKANIRAAIAAVNAVALSPEYNGEVDFGSDGYLMLDNNLSLEQNNGKYVNTWIRLKQTKDGWSDNNEPDWGNVEVRGVPIAGCEAVVQYNFTASTDAGDNFEAGKFYVIYVDY